MPRRAPLQVGHHVYTAQDARKSIESLGALWRHHRHQSEVPDGWLAGARGFLAEYASLASVSLPPLENLDVAFDSITAATVANYERLDQLQIESMLAALWRFMPTMRRLSHHHVGAVAHLHASRGLPKQPITRATVTFGGVDGDVQEVRAHHGRPWQALCIWSVEALDALTREGHPIGPGFAGENITVSGVPATAFRPGAHFRIGEVRGFMTAYAIPCKKNAGWFVNHDFNRMHHEQGDESRIYAMVTATGTIGVGDPFELFSDR